MIERTIYMAGDHPCHSRFGVALIQSTLGNPGKARTIIRPDQGKEIHFSRLDLASAWMEERDLVF